MSSSIERLTNWSKQHSNVTPLDGTDRESPTFGDLREVLTALSRSTDPLDTPVEVGLSLDCHSGPSEAEVEAVALAILNSDREMAGFPPVTTRAVISDSEGYVANAKAALAAMRRGG